MTLEQIETAMLDGNIPPAKLGELRVILGAKYSQAMNHLEAILMEKPIHWNKLRLAEKSDKATDRRWEASDLGLKETHWRMQIKKIEKMMSALKMQWDIVNTELRNLS